MSGTPQSPLTFSRCMEGAVEALLLGQVDECRRLSSIAGAMIERRTPADAKPQHLTLIERTEP